MPSTASSSCRSPRSTSSRPRRQQACGTGPPTSCCSPTCSPTGSPASCAPRPRTPRRPACSTPERALGEGPARPAGHPGGAAASARRSGRRHRDADDRGRRRRPVCAPAPSSPPSAPTTRPPPSSPCPRRRAASPTSRAARGRSPGSSSTPPSSPRPAGPPTSPTRAASTAAPASCATSAGCGCSRSRCARGPRPVSNHELASLLVDAERMPAGGPVIDVDDDAFIPPGDMPAPHRGGRREQWRSHAVQTPPHTVQVHPRLARHRLRSDRPTGRRARPGRKSTSSTSSAAARRTSCSASSPPTSPGCPSSPGRSRPRPSATSSSRPAPTAPLLLPWRRSGPTSLTTQDLRLLQPT